MRLKNLFDPTVVVEITDRVARLRPDSERLWGKMSAAQMLAHCCVSLQWALGEVVPDRVFVGLRMIGRVIKPMALKDDAAMRRNSPTAKSLVIADERDLTTEREKLNGLIERFAAGGAAGCTEHPHSFFGKLTPEEWSVLMYKHLDHHLRQFGV